MKTKANATGVESINLDIGGPSLKLSQEMKLEDSVETASHLFQLLDVDEIGEIISGQFIEFLDGSGLKMGLHEYDPRLKGVWQKLQDMDGLRKDVPLDMDAFVDIIGESTVLIGNAIKGHLIVPDFITFCDEFEQLFESVRDITDGAKATYIPALEHQDETLWAASVCTIDGQEFSVGDSDYRFCVQSCCKPIAYLIACQEQGFDIIHGYVGREPSGQSFNNLALKESPCEEFPKRKIPHNPMINAGAIMSCSLIMNKSPMADRFSKVMSVWNKMCASPVSFSNSVYLSEKDTADRNWCLGYMMQEYDSFPPGTNLRDTLEFYFQQCSIEGSCRQMSILASTLANGGVNPKTGERIFDPFHVRNCLSLMLSSGMYDYSGAWGFDIGLPAKSGVAGCVWLVIPNKMGIATFSPRLDDSGNSNRGVAFSTELVQLYNFHIFDNLKGVVSATNDKKDPTQRQNEQKEHELTSLLFAAAHGDSNEIVRLQAQGADILGADYDFRTALHLAASEGHIHVIKLLVAHVNHHFSEKERAEELSARDRWDRTPLDDAVSGNHLQVQQLLEEHGAQRGGGKNQKNISFTASCSSPIKNKTKIKSTSQAVPLV